MKDRAYVMCFGRIVVPGKLPEQFPAGACIMCGCTRDRACPGGCYWTVKDMCSRCAADLAGILEPPMKHRANVWAAIEACDDINILHVALRNASGDWRRAAIAKRLRELTSSRIHEA